MTEATDYEPFLSYAEAKCLDPVATGRIGGLGTPQDLFDLVLADGSEFASVVHGAPGNWGHEEENWAVDGVQQFEGLLRKVTFFAPVRTGASAESTGKTMVSEEQRFHAPSQSSAVWEVRRFLRDVPDADKFVVVIRLMITFDGFAASFRVLCGVHYFKRSAKAKDIRDAAVRAYKLSFERWCGVIDRYARKHDDGVWGRTRWKKSKDAKDTKDKAPAGAGSAAGSEVPRSASLVPVLSALRSSVGSSNSLQLDKCHSFLGQHIYVTSHFVKAIQGEEPGDLVLEEREWALSDRANAFEDLDDLRSAVSHGSSVDHAGYVDFPAGLPAAQWSRVLNEKMVKWLMRGSPDTSASAGASTGGGGGGGSGGGGSTVGCGSAAHATGPSPAVASRGSLVAGSAGLATPASTLSARWEQDSDPVQQKWLEQLEATAKGDTGTGSEIPGDLHSRTGSVDAESSSVLSELSAMRTETFTATREAGVNSGAESAENAPAKQAADTSAGVGVSKASSVPYTVSFYARRLGLQLRELHGIPVVGGLQGYDPDGSIAAALEETGDGGGGAGDGAGGGGEDYEMEVVAMEGTNGSPTANQGFFDDFQSVMGGSDAPHEIQTLYGGTATETSSILASDLADQDVTVKCIVECPQVFGAGVKKLWRWRPNLGSASELAEDAATALPLFHGGLALRLGYGARDTNHEAGQVEGTTADTAASTQTQAAAPLSGTPLLRVSYLDPEVGELLELDAEAWPDFIDLKSKRLFVTLGSPPEQLSSVVEGKESESEAAASDVAAVDVMLPEETNGENADAGSAEVNDGTGASPSAPADAEPSNVAAESAAGTTDGEESLAGQMATLRSRLEGAGSTSGGASPTLPPPQPTLEENSKHFVAGGDTGFDGGAAERLAADETNATSRDGGGGSSSDKTGAPLAAGAARRPCIGAVLVSVNGVRTQSLRFANVVELLTTQRRPIVLEFVDSWDTIFHSHLMETEVREKISRATFEQKMRHPLATKLRKQIDEYMTVFKEQDLKALMSEAAEGERERQRRRASGGGEEDQQADPQQSPAGALWSLVRWLEQELPEVGIFSNSHRAGGGLPVMGELQWNDVRQHLERLIFEQVFDECLAAAPDYATVDMQVTERLASLRFLKPKNWCVDFLDDGTGPGDADGDSAAGREWDLAQRELCRVIECRCPRDMIDCVTACVRLVALSVEASLQRRHTESETGGAKKKKAIAVGADDLLAALTWVVVQANPPRLASRLWYMSYYMRDPARGGGGEGAYCITQLASALQFARAADASVLADVTQAQLEEGLARHAVTQTAIRAASAGDRDVVERVLFEGADPNGLSSDQQNTVLTAAVVAHHLPIVKTVLHHPDTDINVRVCPNFGRYRGRTALMLAAEAGDMGAVLSLLSRATSAGRAAVDADGHNAVDCAKTREIAAVLLADPAKVTVCQAAKAGSLQYVEALLLQGQDPNAADASGIFTPLISATLLGSLSVIEALLRNSTCDPDKRNSRGETALMYSVQREGHATPDSQVAAAVMLLAHGADRYARDRDGRTALDWAERYGSARLADVIRVDPRQVEIYAAAKDRDVRAVMALLEQGVDPNARCPVRDFTALIASVFNKDEDMVRALLQHPHTDPNRPGKHGMTPLMYAGQAGHERMVCLLLQLKADRYRLSERGESALEMAAVRGFETVVNILKFDPERLSICISATNNDWPAVQGLVAQGVSVNARHRVKTPRGWQHDRYTPLIAACAAGHAALVKRLLEWEVLDVDLQNLLGQTALMYAAARGLEELVLTLLATDCDRYATDGSGRTALTWAQASGHKNVVPVLRVDPKRLSMPAAAAAGATEDVWALMRQGVAPDEARAVNMEELFKEQVKAAGPGDAEEPVRRANFYRSSFAPAELALTPLAAAAIFGRVHVAAMLLDGAPAAAIAGNSGLGTRVSVAVDTRDPLGRTALMQAARFGSEDIVLLLLNAGANRYKKDKERKTASELAIAAGHLGIAGIISADPKRLDLIDVAAEGKLVLVDGLLKQGVPVDYCHPDKRHAYGTPLIAAAANARGDVVRLLLRQPDLAVDRPNARGETALMAACGAGALGVARQLLTAGADRTKKDRKGMTAEHHAYNRKGHVNMILVKALLGVS